MTLEENDIEFYNYAKARGFYIALRDLKIERSDWARLQKMMQESLPEEPRSYGTGHPYN